MPSNALRKSYPVHQSPLYMVRSKGQLEALLGVEWHAVQKLIDADSYRTWVTDKQRQIQAPKNWMAAVHRRLALLLGRIQVPDYVYSKRGRSYVDNAAQHLGSVPLVKTDISRFFPSVTRAMVRRMFVDDFLCAPDVASRLADICCFRQAHLPTGSPISGPLSFLARRHLFDNVAKLASAHGCRFTLYVDDITLSGPGANMRLLGEVRELISAHGLRTKSSKSRSYAAGRPKSVTGVIVAGNDLRLPNERHRKLHTDTLSMRSASGEEKENYRRRVVGRQREAEQILGRTQTKGPEPPRGVPET